MDSKGGDMESKLKSVLRSYLSLTMPGKREIDNEVGFSCLICFLACVFCLVLLFGIRTQPLSPITPQNFQMSFENFIFINKSTINIK